MFDSDVVVFSSMLVVVWYYYVGEQHYTPTL